MIFDTLLLLAELLALFFAVTFGVFLVQRRLGSQRLRAWMGGSPLTSALKGIAIGFVTPFCTYSAIPMLIGLRQAGVPPAGYVAFITAAPVLDPVILGALVLIIGPGAAGLYTAVAFTAALGLALVAQRSSIETHLKPLPLNAGFAVGSSRRTTETAAIPERLHASLADSSQATTPPTTGLDPGGSTGCDTGCDPQEQPWQGFGIEARAATRAAVALLRSVGWILLAGLGIGMAIEVLVSPTDVAAITGDNGVLAVPVAAALGTPLYIETSLFIPIADALAGAGVGVGAIVALTISGAGANIPEFVILTRLADRKLITVFIAYVFAVAMIGGLLAHALLA